MAEKQVQSKIQTWWNEVKAEWYKIIWPSKEDLVKETGTVAVVSIVLGIIIAILDYLIQHGLDWLISL